MGDGSLRARAPLARLDAASRAASVVRPFGRTPAREGFETVFFDEHREAGLGSVLVQAHHVVA